MKHLQIILLSTLIILVSQPLFSQNYGTGHSYTTESTVKNPIDIESVKNGDQYILYAMNKTYYPFLVRVKLVDVINMVPAQHDRNYHVYPGKNELLALTAKDQYQPYSYNFNFSFTIGIPCEEIDTNHPYLLPIKESFGFQALPDDSTVIMYNFFMPNDCDTVYAMRKGVVVAVPHMYEGNVRISGTESLEIIHSDRTIMVYENLDPESVMVDPETIVYPGQVIGIVKKDKAVGVKLVRNNGNNHFEIIEHYYYIDENSIAPFSLEMEEVTTPYPEEIVTMEMTKKELKQFKKGKL